MGNPKRSKLGVRPDNRCCEYCGYDYKHMRDDIQYLHQFEEMIFNIKRDR